MPTQPLRKKIAVMLSSDALIAVAWTLTIVVPIVGLTGSALFDQGRHSVARTTEAIAAAVRDDIVTTKTVNEVAVTAGGVLVGSPTKKQTLLAVDSADASYDASARTLTVTGTGFGTGAVCKVVLPTHVATVTADCAK